MARSSWLAYQSGSRYIGKYTKKYRPINSHNSSQVMSFQRAPQKNAQSYHDSQSPNHQNFMVLS
ncbi:hypothetical protein AO373_1718 [Moraxella catarrhalis]|uniref:Uncharacterized protein n=1 Tax=Moraxella catarrhalis TaxID=480 RepID=A0AB36DMK4_MORCA|nr:hypothetical protein AO381_1174 [Moraxella catarrhalis]OAV17476.1 hypothetical protein AO373_1718 [Moraxella catarrhalis]OAV23039.1 hypothetical protein AO370_1697 [Moraxella catarrhalis]